MTIINMAPHPIIILNEKNEIILSIPASGNTIRLSTETVPSGELLGIPLTRTSFGFPLGLPEFVEGTFYIVSQLVKSALASRTDLLVPAEVVRDTDGNIKGCRSLGM